MSPAAPQQRVRYVLPLANESPGHRLGVNGLAFDAQQSVLYTGGRDGIVAAWDASWTTTTPPRPSPAADTACLSRVQAHTHWINDLILVRNGQAVVTASSDTSVKLWRPGSAESNVASFLGSHDDYVKCITSPSSYSSWVASAGLDRHVVLWDLEGAGSQLRFAVSEEASEKGSVYALASTQSVIASGGPDSIVRLHDTRSGQRAARFIGHTDNIRSVLISQSQDVVVSCSSDRTIKVWSITAGRCLYNLAIHGDSVWSLFSDHPSLSYFFSGDRSGIVAKTDCRGSSGGGIDQAVSFAVCQESEGINRMLAANGNVWTGTAKPNVNAWKDLDTAPGALSIDSTTAARRDATGRSRGFSLSINGAHGEGTKIPVGCVLRMPSLLGGFSHNSKHRSRLSTYHSIAAKRGSLAGGETEFGPFAPLRSGPERVIQGQPGVIKHVLLNDKRRVLTLDTAGEVALWDLLGCRQLKSLGNRDLAEVVDELSTKEIVQDWCSISTNIGTVLCTIDEKLGFDGEVYADQLEGAQDRGFAEDFRLNLGCWVLRYLFDDLVREERERDAAVRRKLLGESKISPTGFTLDLPPPSLVVDEKHRDSASGTTPRAYHPAQNTPGLFAIGAATPFLSASPATVKAGDAVGSSNSGSAPQDDNSKRLSQTTDYFSAKAAEENTDTSSNASQKPPLTPTEGPNDASRTGPGKDATTFGQRFRNTFSSKKSARTATSPGPSKIAQSDSKADDPDAAPGAGDASAAMQDKRMINLLQEMQHDYAEKVKQDRPNEIQSALRPCIPEESMILRPPPRTMVLIQELEKPDSSLAVKDTFHGFQGNLGKQASSIEQAAPYWLGALLLKNERPVREAKKLPFYLKPYDNTLPQISLQQEGNDERLTANRIIRLYKALEYVTDRLRPVGEDDEATQQLRPEDCIEIWCQNERLALNMTLAQVQRHVWKGPGDVVLNYRSTGRRKYDLKPAADQGAPKNQAS